MWTLEFGRFIINLPLVVPKIITKTICLAMILHHMDKQLPRPAVNDDNAYIICFIRTDWSLLPIKPDRGRASMWDAPRMVTKMAACCDVKLKSATALSRKYTGNKNREVKYGNIYLSISFIFFTLYEIYRQIKDKNTIYQCHESAKIANCLSIVNAFMIYVQW